MGVEPKIGVVNPPKWMVKIMEKPIKMDDLGLPLFSETSRCCEENTMPCCGRILILYQSLSFWTRHETGIFSPSWFWDLGEIHPAPVQPVTSLKSPGYFDVCDMSPLNITKTGEVSSFQNPNGWCLKSPKDRDILSQALLIIGCLVEFQNFCQPGLQYEIWTNPLLRKRSCHSAIFKKVVKKRYRILGKITYARLTDIRPNSWVFCSGFPFTFWKIVPINLKEFVGRIVQSPRH